MEQLAPMSGPGQWQGRRLVVQDHSAAVRYEATSVSFLESQLASGLRAVMLTRMVPFDDIRHCIFYFNNGAVGFGVSKSVVTTNIDA